jgi:hypothetical protein
MGSTGDRITEALRRAHVALLDDLRKLEEAARPASGESLKGLFTRLAATHAHLTRHFRFEEQDGYMDEVRKREPRLERAVEQLAEEHRRLAHALDALTEEAGEAESLGEPLRQKVREWVERVRQHEDRENDLVQDAFNLDIGPED